MVVASAKSRSARGASHHLAFMSGCLTISHTCLPSERKLRFWRYLFVIGREVSSELGTWEK